ERGRGSRKDRCPGQDRRLPALSRQVRSLQNARRAAHLHPVVRQNQTTRPEGHRRRRERRNWLRSGELVQDLLRVDVQHPRLVHLAPALVGPPHPSEEHTSELQSLTNLVCRLLLEKKKSRDR